MTNQHNPVGVKTVEISADSLNEILIPAYREVQALRIAISAYARYRDKTLEAVQESKRSRTWLHSFIDPSAKHRLEMAVDHAEREDRGMCIYHRILHSQSWENTLEMARVSMSLKLEEQALLNIFNYKPDNTRYHLDTISEARNAYRFIRELLESMSLVSAVTLASFLTVEEG